RGDRCGAVEGRSRSQLLSLPQPTFGDRSNVRGACYGRFVSGASHSQLDGGIAELAAAAWSLTPPAPHERADVLRSESAMLLDRLLTRVARGRAALDIAIGEGLLALGAGHRTMRFGHAGIGDYARERLGIKASTAVKMAR